MLLGDREACGYRQTRYLLAYLLYRNGVAVANFTGPTAPVCCCERRGGRRSVAAYLSIHIQAVARPMTTDQSWRGGLKKDGLVT